MIEGRALIRDIEHTKCVVEALGAHFKSTYTLKDIIFIPRKGEYNLSEDVLRVRVNIESDWPTKRVILVRKQTTFKNTGKEDKILLKKEFDTLKEANTFIQAQSPAFKKGFEYTRTGWQYQLHTNRIFIEDIHDWRPSIEIEAENETELEHLFNNIGILERIKETVPEIMRKIKQTQ